MQSNCCIVVGLLHNCIATWVHLWLAGTGEKCWWGSFWRGSTSPLPIFPGQEAFAKNGKLTRTEGPKCTPCSSFRNHHPTHEWLQPRALEIEWIFNGDFETSCPGPKVDQGPSPESYDLVTALNLPSGRGGRVQFYGLYCCLTTCWIAIQHLFGRFEVADVCDIARAICALERTLWLFQQVLVHERHKNSLETFRTPWFFWQTPYGHMVFYSLFVGMFSPLCSGPWVIWSRTGYRATVRAWQGVFWSMPSSQWGTCCMGDCTLSAIIARTGQVPDRTASLFSWKFAFHQNGRRTHLEAGWPGLHIRPFETNFYVRLLTFCAFFNGHDYDVSLYLLAGIILLRIQCKISEYKV